eukprot:TRINITY_DN77538_c0_g1_i1.p1 TRINITY_DN77538_c0_g1~~TRINITY_DN77538_c0_g1_i1.p1  ORF type:complete len:223 (-),score=54.90 TRINITY_DN77538_c0_g1_i1:70-738(-)
MSRMAQGYNDGASTTRSETLLQLQHMGFPQSAAEQALLVCGSAEAAVEWLIGPEGQAASLAASNSQSSCAPAPEVEECSICCEDLVLADAAMRCAGHGGKKHYFHARCLTEWIRQCQRDGADVTCPECRGPVQIQQCRLREFMQEAGTRLGAEDAEAMRTFTNAAQDDSTDKFGWSDVKPHLWKVGVGMGIVAGVAVAVAAGVHLLSAANKRSDDRRDRRRS